MSSGQPDALIVGAGPAGATLAGLLAGAGMRVLLVDQARFPRPKPCGECLNPGALATLERLGLWEVAAPLAPAPLRGWRMHVGGRFCDLDFPAGRSAAAVERMRFDAALLNWAAARGADVVEGVRVTDLLSDGRGRVTGARAGRRTLPAPVTVGADGLRSVVVRRLGLLGRRSVVKVAWTAHWEGISELGDRGELHLLAGGAVVGVAPLGPPGMANVVLVMPADAVRGLSMAAALTRWAPERFGAARCVGPVLATGPFDQPVRTMAVPGALLVGDAAGYFDPFTGQGIYRALRSAELAAAHLLGKGPYALAEFRPAERRQRWVDAVVRHQPLAAAAAWGLGHWPAAGRWLLGLLGDCERGGN